MRVRHFCHRSAEVLERVCTRQQLDWRRQPRVTVTTTRSSVVGCGVRFSSQSSAMAAVPPPAPQLTCDNSWANEHPTVSSRSLRARLCQALCLPSAETWSGTVSISLIWVAGGQGTFSPQAGFCASVQAMLRAIRRKLLLHLNAVARRGTPWLPQEEWQSEPSRA